MNNLSNHKIFIDSTDSLKRTSFDNCNKVYMTESEIKVINFDNVKKKYLDSLESQELEKNNKNSLMSCDALFFGYDNIVYFIEFKNGNIRREIRDVKIKIAESLLVFSDITNKTLSYTRENMHFILVFNEDKNEKYSIRRKVFTEASEELCFYFFEKYKKMYFKKVFTYTEKEFKKYFVNRYSKDKI